MKVIFAVVKELLKAVAKKAQKQYLLEKPQTTNQKSKYEGALNDLNMLTCFKN